MDSTHGLTGASSLGILSNHHFIMTTTACGVKTTYYAVGFHLNPSGQVNRLLSLPGQSVLNESIHLLLFLHVPPRTTLLAIHAIAPTGCEGWIGRRILFYTRCPGTNGGIVALLVVTLLLTSPLVLVVVV